MNPSPFRAAAVLLVFLALILVVGLGIAQPLPPGPSCGAVPDRNGVMGPCQRPHETPPPAPRICEVPERFTWEAAGNTCTAIAGGSLQSGDRRVIRPDAGPTDGMAMVRCTNGVLSTAFATCSRVTECVVSDYRGTDDGGATWWRFSGHLREGATGQARADDGRTRAIECSGGRVRLR